MNLASITPSCKYFIPKTTFTYEDAGDPDPCAATTGVGFEDDFEAVTGDLPDCWQSINGVHMKSAAYYAHGGAKSLNLIGGNGTNIPVAVLPAFNNTGDLYVKFYHKVSNTFSEYAFPQVGYMTDPTDASTFVTVKTLTKSLTYTQAKVSMAGAPAGSYVAIRLAGGTTVTDLYVDDIEITEQPSCTVPTSVSGVATSQTEANISWTKSTESAWLLVYSSDNGMTWSDEIAVAAGDLVDGKYPLTGLASGQSYIVKVKSDCGEDIYSDWSAASPAFKTPCDAMSIAGFVGTFESDAAGSGLMPDCWDAVSYTYNNVTYPYVRAGYSAHDGDNWLHFYGGANTTKNIAVLPIFTEALNTLTISFYYKNYNTYSGQFSVGYYKNGTFTAYEGASNLERKTTYTYFEMAIPNVVEAEGARLAIQYAGGSYSYDAYIDDVTVTLTPSCTKPSGITVSNIVYDGATIDWTENGSATAWKVQYSTNNTDWTTANGGANVTAHPYDLRGLTSGTPYYIRVIAVCDPTDESPAAVAASTFTPTCVKPDVPTIPAKTTTTATIQWTVNSGEAEWNLQYKKSSDADWTTVAGVTANPYLLEGLTSGTTYEVRVAATCNGTYTSAAEFDTECEAKPVPYNVDFNDLTALPSCWSFAGATSTMSVSAGTMWLSLDSKALFFSGSGGAYAYAILPEMTVEWNTLQIAFSHREENGKGGDIELGYYQGGTFTPLTSYSNKGDAMQAESAYSLAAIPAGARAAFAYKPVASGYAGAVDDIQVSVYVAPTCADPTALAVSEIGTASAKVTWNSEAAEFALEYKKTSDADWTAATGTIASPFVLGGLSANETEYTVRVKAICGVGNESAWVELALPFKTECEIPDVTDLVSWSTDFEDQTTGTVPGCWSVPAANTGYEYAKIDDAHAKESAKCLDIQVNSDYSKIILLPEFAVEAKYLNIAFDYNNGSTSTNYGPLEVGYYSGSAFTNVTTLARVEDYAASGIIEMPKTAPADARIAFRVVGSKKGSSYYSHSYIDNVVVSRKPACAVPTITAANATSNGAVVTWTPGDEETAWNLRHSVKDADTWTVVEDVTTGYAIIGLSVGTTYEVQVQANCGGTQSAWSASTEFTPVCNAPMTLAVTACTMSAATFSWTSSESAWVLQYSADGENWESENVTANPFTLNGLNAGTAYQAKIQAACGSEFSNIVNFTTWCAATGVLPLNEDFEDIVVNALPACWEKISDGEYPGVVQGSASYEGESGKCVCFFGVGTQILVLPAVSAELAEYKLSFFYKNNNASLELGYINNAGGFELLQALENQTAYGDAAYTYALTNSLMNKNLAFRYVGTSALGSNAYLDVVRISKSVVFADNADNSATLAALNGQTVDVTIGRTITCTGYFNTLCLPFDLPTLAGTPLEGAELWAFDHATVESGELLFRIVEASSVEAGKPYFIQFAAGDAIVSPLFQNVTISASEGIKTGDESVAQLCGILKPETFTPGDKTKLFLYNENALYWWNGASASALNSFRAYFYVNTTSGASYAPRHGMSARIVKSGQTATGVGNVQGNEVQSIKVLENSQVVIIRNGVKYNIQGQVIQ